MTKKVPPFYFLDAHSPVRNMQCVGAEENTLLSVLRHFNRRNKSRSKFSKVKGVLSGVQEGERILGSGDGFCKNRKVFRKYM